MCLFVFSKLIPLNLLCRCLSDISKERYDSVVKDHSCSGGFCKTILEERGQVFWTAFTLLPAHVDPRPRSPTHT